MLKLVLILVFVEIDVAKCRRDSMRVNVVESEASLIHKIHMMTALPKLMQHMLMWAPYTTFSQDIMQYEITMMQYMYLW
jgi:hypothetical protein